MALGVIPLHIRYEAYQRSRIPPEVADAAMLAVAGIGLVANVAAVLILRAGSSESLNMRGAYFEVLSDLLTSVGVLVAGVIMLTAGWYGADPLLSAGIGVFILPRTLRLREAECIPLEASRSPKPTTVDDRRGGPLHAG